MESEQEFRPIVQLFEALEREGILFLIVGMGAAVIQGAATVTRDLDIWIGLPWRQYMRVINLCDQLDATLHSPSAVILKGEHLVNFLYVVTGLKTFAYEYRRAVEVEWLGMKVKMLPIERIIESKKAIQRPKDMVHIVELETLLKSLRSGDKQN